MARRRTSLHVSAGNNAVSALDDAAAIQGFSLSLRASGRSEHTQATYGAAIAGLQRFTRERRMPPLVSLTAEHIREYLNSLYERGNKPATVANRFRSLQQFYRWLVEEGERTDSPMDRISPPRVPDQILPHYGPNGVQKVLDTIGAKTRDVLALRDRAMVITFFDTGLRARELCGLKMESLDLHGLSLLVTGKGGRQRRVGIGYMAAQAIERYHRRRAHSACVFSDRYGGPMTFNAVKMALMRRFQAAGVPFHGVHGFRRGFAIAFLEAGGGPEDLRTLAGWESPQMLRRYTRATETERALKAHRTFSPGDQLQTKGG